MLVQLLIIPTVIFLLYKLSEYYARRYLGFNATNHMPVYAPGMSNSPTLVCVLGWGGSTRRQLRRLLDFYASHAIPTVSYINPMINYTSYVDTKPIEDLLDILLQENRTSTNIIIHLHSNNGAIVWCSMLEMMRSNERYRPLLSNIRGLILDSAPYTRPNQSEDWLIGSAIGTSRACVSIILNRVQFFHIIWSPVIIYYLFFRLIYRRYFSTDPSSASEKIQQILTTTPVNVAQCYLYGAADRLIAPEVIERFLTSEIERGVRVLSHRFSDSGHVNHFRIHPEEYGRLILDFIAGLSSDIIVR